MTFVLRRALSFCAATVVCGFLAFAPSAACKQVEVIPPDHQVEAGGPDCANHLSIQCATGAADATRFCVGDPAATDARRFLPTNVGYTDGCFAYFQQVDCSSQGYCYCAAADASASNPPRWICPP